ncbi:family 43 glycosylhydrolase [Specibacter sp. NPDC078692]|uniref:family 43 glycosylhydrolase n=1 Tax=Specibacter sp. NPDC078692 TaxID=3155818 RepID=UPI00343529FE
MPIFNSAQPGLNVTGSQPSHPLLSRRSLLRGGVAAGIGVAGAPLLGVSALAGVGQLAVQSTVATRPAAHNPLVLQRADPYVLRHTDGRYYFTGSVPEYDRVVLRSSDTLAGLSTATEKVVWQQPSSGSMAGFIWAPEMPRIGGKWYIYFAASDSGDVWHIRMYVLENSSANPMEGTWKVAGQVHTPANSFALDATTFEHEGTQYLVWAEKNPESNLYIAPLLTPTKIGPPVEIAVPTLPWEVIGFKVNEGAAVLKRNGRIFISYSASATDANYCMGLLSADKNADLLDATSWAKAPEPVMSSSTITGLYGPGHNSFTLDDDGSTDMVVYHARDYKNIVGDPLFDPNRHARLQRLYWKADGMPDFGIPVGEGIMPSRLQLASSLTKHVGITDAAAIVAGPDAPLASTQFRLVPGFAGPKTIALEAVLKPGWFLAARGGAVTLEPHTGTVIFADSASFNKRPGLSNNQGTSLEVARTPGNFLRAGTGLDSGTAKTSGDRRMATFFLR